MKRHPRTATTVPTVPELVLSPELATLALLEHTLAVAVTALLAEHPTLIDDHATARDGDPVVSCAVVICRRAAALQDTLRCYTRAVCDAAKASATDDDVDADWPF